MIRNVVWHVTAVRSSSTALKPEVESLQSYVKEENLQTAAHAVHNP